MRRLAVIAILALLVAPLSAGRKYDEYGERTVRETLAFESEAEGRKVQVDNVHGDIVVEAHAGDGVEMVAVETVRARSDESAARGREEVHLDISVEGNLIDIYVDGPFRARDRHGWREHHNPGYQVAYDFKLRVPRDVDLDLRTVNGGEITVTGVRGDFRLSNVNGGVEIRGAAGSGELVTVNGRILAEFEENPAAETLFETVNGEIEARFQPGLSADLELNSRWGEVWSDFEVRGLPDPAPTTKRKGGTTIIRTSHGGSVRVASGGPRLTFETLNGDILIRKSGKVR